MQTEKLYELFQQSTGIGSDTRSIERGNLFFALKGERFNGNHFAQHAIDKGASYAVIDEPSVTQNEKFIPVDSVLTTLQHLAHHHRRQLKAKVIAVCGSNGKTTTKELITRVLETSFQTFSTKGNLNNHIGVPLSILSITKDAGFAVIEIGANHIGETKLLCEIAEPDYGLITNNGKDHLEGYGSIEGVREGNGELYDFLKKKYHIAFVCADQDDLMKMSKQMFRVTYGSGPEAAYSGKLVAEYPFLEIETPNGKLKTRLIGRYNFDNVMAASCIGNYFGITAENIKSAIESYKPINNRSQLLNLGGNTFILDAYNANPSSMNAALDSFFSIPSEKKIVILGDMAELGDASRHEHLAILHKLKDYHEARPRNLEMMVLVGPEFKKADSNFSGSFLHFKDVSELKKWFREQTFSGYHFLMKASRVIGLEKLLDQ